MDVRGNEKGRANDAFTLGVGEVSELFADALQVLRRANVTFAESVQETDELANAACGVEFAEQARQAALNPSRQQERALADTQRALARALRSADVSRQTATRELTYATGLAQRLAQSLRDAAPRGRLLPLQSSFVEFADALRSALGRVDAAQRSEIATRERVRELCKTARTDDGVVARIPRGEEPQPCGKDERVPQAVREFLANPVAKNGKTYVSKRVYCRTVPKEREEGEGEGQGEEDGQEDGDEGREEGEIPFFEGQLLANGFEVALLAGKYVAVGVPVRERERVGQGEGERVAVPMQGQGDVIAGAVRVPALLARGSLASAERVAAAVSNDNAIVRAARVALQSAPQWAVHLAVQVSRLSFWLVRQFAFFLGKREMLRAYPWLAGTYLVREAATKLGALGGGFPQAALAALATASAVQWWRRWRQSAEGAQASESKREKQFSAIISALLPVAAAGAAYATYAGEAGQPVAAVEFAGQAPGQFKRTSEIFEQTFAGVVARNSSGVFGGGPDGGGGGPGGGGGSALVALTALRSPAALDSLAANGDLVRQSDALLVQFASLPGQLVRSWVVSTLFSGLSLAVTGALTGTGGLAIAGAAPLSVASISMVLQAGTAAWAKNAAFSAALRLAFDETARALLGGVLGEVVRSVPILSGAVAALEAAREIFFGTGGAAGTAIVPVSGQETGGVSLQFWRGFWETLGGVAGNFGSAAAGFLAPVIRAFSEPQARQVTRRAAAIAAELRIQELYARGLV